MSAIVTTAFLVSSLLRRADRLGCAATVLARGDAEAGSLTLIGRARNGAQTLYAAAAGGAGGQATWLRMSEPSNDDTAVGERVARIRARDRDAWVVEIEIDDLEAFLKADGGTARDL